jgi:hypothetical protein
MFVQSERFVEEHQGNIKDLSIYGQESNPTTLRLAKMNLAIRGIDAKIELGDTFLADKHQDLKADFILANPPFNVSDWSGEHLRDDVRWKYGVPPTGNANYAWLQHFAHKLSPSGTAGIVLANGSMNSNSGGEGEIRKNMIEAGLIDCMVALPAQLFYNTMLPACLWFLARNRAGANNHSPLPIRQNFQKNSTGGQIMSNRLYESEIEQIALDILHDENGYAVAFGPDLSEGDRKERDYSEVVLQGRLREAIDRLNPAIPAEAREEAEKKALRTVSVNLLENNEAFHRMLTDGIDVKFSIGDGKARTDKVWLVDFADPDNNKFLAVNQFTVLENHNKKRPDIVLLVNGLPLVVMELKNAADENADVKAAFQQLQTYKQVIPSLFTFNAVLIVSDGWFAKVGTLSSDYSRFMEWKTGDGVTIVDTKQESALEPMIKGLLNKRTLLDLIRHFIVFEKTKETTIKKVAAYHHYCAVNKLSNQRSGLPCRM